MLEPLSLRHVEKQENFFVLWVCWVVSSVEYYFLGVNSTYGVRFSREIEVKALYD